MNHFFDVGAHNGNTFPHLGSEYDRWNVWCFEPSPRHIPELIMKGKSLSNRFNVIVCPFGVGGKNEPLEFHLKTDPQGDSFSNTFSENIDAGCKFVVMVYDITELLLRFTSEDDVVHLKLDCETAEYDILRSLIRNPRIFDRVKKLMVEFHNPENFAVKTQWEKDRDELVAACQNLGHTVERWGH